MLAQLETGPDTMESQESTLESSAREPEPESNLESESELESDDSEGDQKSYKSFNDAFFWSIFAGAGVNLFPFDDNEYFKRFGGNFNFGTDVNYFWNDHWGVGVGVTFDYNFNRLKVDDIIQDKDVTWDWSGKADPDVPNSVDVRDTFYLQTDYRGYKEMQYSWRIGVPVEFKYKHAFNDKVGLLAGIGPKFYTTISNTMEVKRGNYSVQGYYPQYGDVLVHDHGPGWGEHEVSDQSLETGMGVGAIGNVYVTRKLNSYLIMYSGLNLEYYPERKKEQDPKVTYTATSFSTADVDYEPDNLDDNSKVGVGLRVGLILNGAKLRQHEYLKKLRKDAEKRQERLLEEEKVKELTLKRLATLDSLANLVYADKEDTAHVTEANWNRLRNIELISDSILNDRMQYDNVISPLLSDVHDERHDKVDQLETIEKKIGKDRAKFNKEAPSAESDSIYFENMNRLGEMYSIKDDLEVNKLAYDHLLDELDYNKPVKQKSLDDEVNHMTATLLEDQKMFEDHQRQIAKELALKEAERIALARADSILNSGEVPSGVIIKLKTTVFSEEELEQIKQPIQFEFGNARITAATRSNLDQLGEILAKYSGLKMSIIGHTDHVGDDNFNMWLGQLRADMIKNSFVKKGFNPKLIETTSRGKSDPLVDNDTDEHRQMNRRVEIIIENVGNFSE